jgi:hypothetical protein
MGIDKLLEELRREWPVIKRTPLLFSFAVLVVSLAAAGCIYWFFKMNLDQKNDLIATLQSQLASKPNVPAARLDNLPPKFRLLLSGGNIFIPDQAPDLTGIVLDATVINTGSPSAAVDWHLSVIPEEGKPQQAQLTRMPPSLVARGPVNTAYLSASESLDESTLKTPLETNVPRSGKLLFYIKIPKAQVMTSVIELSVTDTNGDPFMVRQNLKDWLAR